MLYNRVEKLWCVLDLKKNLLFAHLSKNRVMEIAENLLSPDSYTVELMELSY